MQIVKLTRDMRPWQKGQDVVLPPAIAEKLIANGEAENPRPYPPPDVAPAVPVGVAPQPKRYMTRKRG